MARLEILENRQLLSTITVNTTADDTTADATLSLREAIDVSNGTLAVSSLSTQEQAQVAGAVSTSNTIDFNIPTTDSGFNPATGVWTISLQSALPTIATNAAFIDGYSQTGASMNTLTTADNAVLKIAIFGNNLQADGLTIAQPQSKVSGLDIEHFTGAGIALTAANGAQVSGCFIGTDPTGEIAEPNATGVEVENSGNVIGGPTLGDRNVISGNSGAGAGDGIYFPEKGLNPLNVQVTLTLAESNFIGVDAAGTNALANSQAGIADFGTNNTFGGTASGQGNVISGNGADGIKSVGTITIVGNLIGTDATGNIALGNGPAGAGISATGFPSNVTDTTTIEDNLVSGNLQNGIEVAVGNQSTSTYTIEGNRIGTNFDGTAALGNVGTGLALESVENTEVIENLISGNKGLGLQYSGFGSDLENNIYQGNKIGTDATGTLPLGNTNVGFSLTSAIGNLIGGTSPGEGNMVAFNGADGIDVLGSNPNLSKFVQLTQNSIFENTGRGIYLDINNVSNQFQMPPHLTFTPLPGGTTGTLAGSLVNGLPNASYVIEIYSNPTLPTAGHETGTTFVQDELVTANGSGAGSFSMTVPTGFYSATTTSSPVAPATTGNTSQFASAVGTSALLSTTTSVNSTVDPSTVGQPVTFSAIVAPPAGSTTIPSGSVTFTIDGKAQTPVSLTIIGGVDEALFTTSALAVGMHTVSAAYPGDANFGGSNGSLPTQTVHAGVLLGSQTVITSSMNPLTFGQNVVFTAVVSSLTSSPEAPSGPVIFSIDNIEQGQAPLTVVGGVEEATFSLSTLSVGDHAISAAYSGDPNFGTSQSTLGQTVDAASLLPTTTIVSSSLNPSTVGEPVTFTAVVAPIGSTGTPTGSVIFTIDGTIEAPVTLASGGGADQAQFTTSTFGAGSHTVSAAYGGDATFTTSFANLPTQTVAAASLVPTMTVVSSSLNPSTVGQLVTFTAVVTAQGSPESPTGLVTFTIDGQVETPVPLSIVAGSDQAQFATSTLSAGSHTISAAYSGFPTFEPSSVSLPQQTVNPASLVATTTTVSSPVNPSTAGQSVTFTAIVAAPGSSGTPTGTVVFTIDGNAQSPVSLAVVGGSDEVQLTTSNLSVGSHTVSATYSGDSTFTTSTGALPTQTVDAVPLVATATVLTSAPNPSILGQQVALTATVTAADGSTLTGSVTFFEGTTALATETVGKDGKATFATSSLPAGTNSIIAIYAGDIGHLKSTSNPLRQVVTQPSTTSPTAPTVVSVERFGYHMQQTTVVLSFSTSLDEASATNTQNYKIVSLGGHGRDGKILGRSIVIREAIYNALTKSVTLVPLHRLDIHNRYSLTVNGETEAGLRGATGLLLAAGGPGTNFSTVIDRQTLAGPAPGFTSEKKVSTEQIKHTSGPSPEGFDMLAHSGKLETLVVQRHIRHQVSVISKGPRG